MQLLERFKDPAQWAAVRVGVPICTPLRATLRHKDGAEREIVVTEADLPVIAAKAQHMLAAYGVPLRLTAGHVAFGNDVDETRQPPLLGYGINVRVGTFGPQRLPCILADEYYEPATFAIARGLPYRSPEYLVNKMEIRGVALLIQDPLLNMGMVTCGLDSPLLCCALSNEAPMPDPVVTTPANTTPAAVQTVSQADFDTLRMAFDQEKSDRARVEGELKNENKTLREQVQTLTGERDREACERLVMQLESEGYQLTRADEVEELLKKDKAGRGKHVERVRHFYRKGDPVTAPVPFSASGFVPIADATPDASGAMGEADAKKVTQYVREHPGTSWADATKAALGK